MNHMLTILSSRSSKAIVLNLVTWDYLSPDRPNRPSRFKKFKDDPDNWDDL